MSTVTPDQKRTIEILRAQGETDERISEYLGISVSKRGAKAKPEPETPAEVTPEDLA